LWVFASPDPTMQGHRRARGVPRLTSAASHDLAVTQRVLALKPDARASRGFAQKDMERTLAWNVPGALIAQGA
jgi:hypothetical protein